MNFEKIINDSLPTTARQNNSSKLQISHYLQQFYKQKLDLVYQTPPNHHDAEIHRAASAFGYHPTAQKGAKLTVCPCCLLPINTISLPITISTTPLTGPEGQAQFFPLDSGTSMYFTFIKMVIFYWLLLFVLSSIYPLHLSYLNNDYCRLYPDQCGNSWLIKYSPVKFMRTDYQKYYQIMNVLNFIMIVASIVFFMFYRKYQYHIYGVIDLHNLTQDDFTILVKNIPLKVNSNFGEGIASIEYALRQLLQAKINKFIEQVKNENQTYPEHSSFAQMMSDMQVPPDDNQKVKSISLCFDLSQLEQIAQLRNKSITSQKGQQRENKQDLSTDEINKKQIKLCKSFRQDKQSLFIGKAFVSFQFQHYRDYILHLYQNSPHELQINNQRVKIKKASRTSDINWLNLNVKRRQRILKIMIFYCLAIGILALTFLLILLIFKNQQSNDTTMGSNILIALIVYFTQFILSIVAKKMTSKERHQTKAKQMNSLIIKLTVVYFISNIFIYFLLNLVEGSHYLLNNGLVVRISNFFILTGLLSLPLNLFQVSKKIQLFFHKINHCYNGNKMLQLEYNKIIQLPQFDFADRYSYYLAYNYSLVFYSYITPICLPIFITIASCHYWIDKYNLLRCSSNLVPLGFAISRTVLKSFQVTILFLAAANYLFAIRLTSQFTLINFVAIIIALGYSLLATLAPAAIEEKIFGKPHQIETKGYTKSLSSGCFRQNYWGCNPATMLIAQGDINRPNKFVNYCSRLKIAQIKDLNDYKRNADSISFQ